MTAEEAAGRDARHRRRSGRSRTHRGPLRAIALVALALGVAACTADRQAGGPDDDLARLVNPFTGTRAGAPDFGTGGGAGNTFPGASAPFAMVQWSPDTPGGENSPGGYGWGDSVVRGFSLTHLSGVGCPVFQDFPFLPTTAPVTRSPVIAGSYEVVPEHLSSYDHGAEAAEPGYYRVLLQPGSEREIDVELTATTRTGLGRFTFPATADASLLINAGGSAMANGDAVLEVDPARREVSGWVESGQFCYHRNRYRVFFAAEFDRPFSAFGTWTRQALHPGGTAASDHAEQPLHFRPFSSVPSPPTTSNGAQAGAWVTFDARSERVVRARVGLSFVSVENARANLAAEGDGFDLERVRTATRAAWNELLGRIRVSGGTEPDLRTFYTMLYHALLGPNVFSDANGDYMGMDGAIHRAEGFTAYTSFSGWDVYRSQMPLLAMIVPERASDMMQSLVANARESGWLPRWSVAAGHTDVMVGDPAAAILAEANAFGATAFDREAALAAMRKGANESGRSPNADYVERQGLTGYLEHGYVPHDGTEGSHGGSSSMFGQPEAVWGSAATTLEYTTADFAIARLAAALGERATCEEFARRAAGWRNLFNPATGYLQPRYADGRFLEPFDPASLDGYVEGNAAQYSWMVPHDVAGLVDAFGGLEATTARLDAFFAYLNAGDDAPFAYLGNEPCALTPWIYAWLGRPERTQEVVRRAMLALFDDSPGGYPGNDDVGQMSAWWIFGALGLYPAIPGTDVLVLGSPLFEEATLALPGGALRIRGRGAARDRPYVSRVRLDGREQRRSWVRFAELAGGAELDFELTGRVEEARAAAAEDAPPSFPPERAEEDCAAQ